MSSKRSPEDVDAGDVELEAWRRASRRGLTDDAERRAVRTIRGVVDDMVDEGLAVLLSIESVASVAHQVEVI